MRVLDSNLGDGQIRMKNEDGLQIVDGNQIYYYPDNITYFYTPYTQNENFNPRQLNEAERGNFRYLVWRYDLSKYEIRNVKNQIGNGILNFRLSCYMNAVMQCLNRIDDLRKYFLEN